MKNVYIHTHIYIHTPCEAAASRDSRSCVLVIVTSPSLGHRPRWDSRCLGFRACLGSLHVHYLFQQRWFHVHRESAYCSTKEKRRGRCAIFQQSATARARPAVGILPKRSNGLAAMTSIKACSSEVRILQIIVFSGRRV